MDKDSVKKNTQKQGSQGKENTVEGERKEKMITPVYLPDSQGSEVPPIPDFLRLLGCG